MASKTASWCAALSFDTLCQGTYLGHQGLAAGTGPFPSSYGYRRACGSLTQTIRWSTLSRPYSGALCREVLHSKIKHYCWTNLSPWELSAQAASCCVDRLSLGKKQAALSIALEKPTFSERSFMCKVLTTCTLAGPPKSCSERLLLRGGKYTPHKTSVPNYTFSKVVTLRRRLTNTCFFRLASAGAVQIPLLMFRTSWVGGTMQGKTGVNRNENGNATTRPIWPGQNVSRLFKIFAIVW
jgi:hypothetical protein